jgi:hypothetical protein
LEAESFGVDDPDLGPVQDAIVVTLPPVPPGHCSRCGSPLPDIRLDGRVWCSAGCAELTRRGL